MFIQDVLYNRDEVLNGGINMSNLMEQIRKYALLRVIAYIFFGIIIVMNPNAVFNLAVYFISAYTAIMGLLSIYEGVKIKRATGEYGMSMTGGILLLVLAGVILVFAKGIVSILPIFLGLIIVVVGIIRFIQANNLKNYPQVNWKSLMIYAGITFLAGLVLVFNPFSSLLFLFQLFGAILIFMGISELIAFFQLRKIK